MHVFLGIGIGVTQALSPLFIQGRHDRLDIRARKPPGYGICLACNLRDLRWVIPSRKSLSLGTGHGP